MKKLLILFLLLLIPIIGPVAQPKKKSQPDFVKNQKPTEGQITSIKNLETRIISIRQDIEVYYRLMKKWGLIDENGKSTIPMQSALKSYYGRRYKSVYNLGSIIQWKDSLIERFYFEQRIARYGSLEIVKKKWYGQEFGKEDGSGNYELEGISINLIVFEVKRSGVSEYLNFRFFTGEDVRKKTKDVSPLTGSTIPTVIHVKNVNRRISMLREYKNYLLLLKRRIDWLIRSSRKREEGKLDEMIKAD